MLRHPIVVIAIGWVIVTVGVLYLVRDGFLQYRDVPKTFFATNTSSDAMGQFRLSSTAFENGGSIPTYYTCDEKQMSPPLSIAGTPAGAQSIVLLLEDPDVPKNLKPDGLFLHWLVFNIPPTTTSVSAGEVFGVSGNNGADVEGYIGPCPPPQYEPKEHRYYFHAFALDTVLALPAGAPRATVETAMAGHVIASSTLMGTYSRREK